MSSCYNVALNGYKRRPAKSGTQLHSVLMGIQIVCWITCTPNRYKYCRPEILTTPT